MISLARKSPISRLLPILLMLLFASACGRSEGKFEKAPDFTLKDLAGNEVNLSQMASQGPVLIAFWASWCPSCVNEIPRLNEIQKEYAPQGLKILGVNVQEQKTEIENFIKDTPIDYTILMDEKGDVSTEYGLTALPVVVFLAKGKEILYYGFTLPDIHKYMEEALKKG